jgi:hypothetical protein
MTVAVPIAGHVDRSDAVHALERDDSRGARPDGRVKVTPLVAASVGDCVIEVENAIPSSPESGVAVALSCGL